MNYRWVSAPVFWMRTSVRPCLLLVNLLPVPFLCHSTCNTDAIISSFFFLKKKAGFIRWKIQTNTLFTSHFCLPFTPSFITPTFRPLMIVMLQCDAGHESRSFSPQQKEKRNIDLFSFNHRWSEFFTEAWPTLDLAHRLARSLYWPEETEAETVNTKDGPCWFCRQLIIMLKPHIDQLADWKTARDRFLPANKSSDPQGDKCISPWSVPSKGVRRVV